MVSVDDYSVYVTEIKTALRKLEDYCLQAEIDVTDQQFSAAKLNVKRIDAANARLESYIHKKFFGREP